MQNACSRKIQAIEPVKIIAPLHLVQIQDLPHFSGSNNGELLEYTRLLQNTLTKQNINTKAIKTWLETL